jgi:hypothetical protein
MYVIRMILAFSCVMYEEAYWNQVSINEMYFSLFDNINAKTETTSDE